MKKWIFLTAAIVMVAAVGVVLGLVRRHELDAQDALIATARAAAARAIAERNEALNQKRITDSLVAIERARGDSARKESARLVGRLDSLKRQQPHGQLDPLPPGEEPMGTSWQLLYFLADSALTKTQIALSATTGERDLLSRDRDHWVTVADTLTMALVKVDSALTVAVKKSECHLLYVISCPSRKESFVVGVVTGAVGKWALSRATSASRQQTVQLGIRLPLR